jgi:hypothetical protein
MVGDEEEEEKEEVFFSLGDRARLLLTRVTSGAPPGGGGRLRLSSTCNAASVSVLFLRYCVVQERVLGGGQGQAQCIMML